MKRSVAFTALCLMLFSSMFCPTRLFPAVTSGADFLKIPRSARAIALGESYTAVIDDPTAIDYNPAALNTMRNLAVSLMYQSWIDNTYGAYAALGYRFRDLVIGGSFYFFNYGGITEYDYFGNEAGSYFPYDMNIKVAASLDGGFLWNALKGFSVGATFSAISRSMISESQWGLAVDAGINYKTVLGNFIKVEDEALKSYFNRLPIDIGFVIQNLGYASETVTPVRFSAGLAVTAIPDLIVSMDLTKDVYNTPWMFKMGFEYTLFEILSLRTGFNLGRDTGNVAMGLGLRYPMLFNNLRFDYAFTPLGVLGNNHNFSFYGEFFFDVSASDFLEKGKIYMYKGEYLKARDMWEKAYHLDPENNEIKENLLTINRIITAKELDDNRSAGTGKPVVTNRDEAFEGPGVTVKGTNVTFFYGYLSHRIRSVAVTGDFVNWNGTGIPLTEGTNGWTVSFDLKPGLYQYKYVINRTISVIDLANPQIMTDGRGGLVSAFEVKEVPVPETNILSNEMSASSEGQESVSSLPSEGSSVSSAQSENYIVTNIVQIQPTNEVITIPITVTNLVSKTNIVSVNDGRSDGRSTNFMKITTMTNVIQTNKVFYYKPQAAHNYYGKRANEKKLQDLLINNLRSYYFYNSFGSEGNTITFPLYGDTMFDAHPEKYLKKSVEQKERKKTEPKPAPKPAPKKKTQVKKAPVKKADQSVITNKTRNAWPNTGIKERKRFDTSSAPDKNTSAVTNVRKKVSPVIETYH